MGVTRLAVVLGIFEQKMPPKRDQQVANPTPMQVPANAEPYRGNKIKEVREVYHIGPKPMVKVQEFKNHWRVTNKQTQSTTESFKK
ncbi:hypothetical protein L3Y34_016503 [Caenorhabditis briggsae]|uniref:Uncharacterized protein n=1 Tax=Caenorhabditis briggsae TaxID=6238 RepID=A0AAE9DZF0_CAEBR|nr:hypothetical protein L3Y34_016503 [Caenorhabditis briggsae]